MVELLHELQEVMTRSLYAAHGPNSPDLRLVITGVAFLLASGCATSRPPSPALPPSVSTTVAGSLEHTLREEISRWHGTPHVWGGMSPRGADCSGFVQSVYRDALAIDLPRTTSEQVSVGRTINVGELQSGDLVFFRPKRATNHVGIYLSDGYFAHISTSRGLTYSHLDDDYWKRAYWTSRRVLSVPPTINNRPSLVERLDEAPRTQRGGW